MKVHNHPSLQSYHRVQAAAQGSGEQSGSEQPFDLDKIDTPEEALLMPVVDLVAGLVSGNTGAKETDVEVTVGGQKINYTIDADPQHPGVTGSINGADFKLSMKQNPLAPGKLVIAGDIPGGEYKTTVEAVPGGVAIKGKVGEIPVEETLSLNPFDGSADIEGTLGGEEFTAHIGSAEDDPEVAELKGQLGDKEYKERILPNIEGYVVVQGNIADTAFTEKITPRGGRD